MTTYEEVSFLCATIAKLKTKVGASIPGTPIVAMMVIHALTDRMQWAKGDWSMPDDKQEGSKDGKTFTCTAEFRVPIGSAPLHAIVHVKSQPEAGMYTVQVFSVTRTFHIYDELALAALVTEAASQVRKGLLESAFGLS